LLQEIILSAGSEGYDAYRASTLATLSPPQGCPLCASRWHQTGGESNCRSPLAGVSPTLSYSPIFRFCLSVVLLAVLMAELILIVPIESAECGMNFSS